MMYLCIIKNNIIEMDIVVQSYIHTYINYILS